MEKRKKAATESGALILVIAGILVACNALGYFGVSKRVDTTKTERFTLSKGSGNLLRSMKQTLTVEAYVTRGLPKLDAFVRDLRDLLQDYKDSAPGKFEYAIIDAKDEESKKKAKEAGLQEQPFAEVSETDEEAGIKQGYMGLVLKYVDKQEVLDLPSSSDQAQGLEFWISNKIRQLTYAGDGIKHKICTLSGHDEMKLSDSNLTPHDRMQKVSMQSIVQHNFPFYEMVDADLKNGDSEIDESCEGLMILQPNKDLTEKELRRIDQFLLKGKSLVVFASAVNVAAGDASMKGTLNSHGLEKLLDGYGIELRKDVALDFGRSFRVNAMTNTGVVAIPLPQLLMVQDDPRFTGNEQLLDTSFQPFFRMEQLSVPFASTLVVHPEKQPEATPKVVMRTTPRTVRSTGDTVDLKPIQEWRPKGEQGQFAIGAYLEGTLKTAFPGGDKQGVEAPEKGAKPSRIFVLASSQFLANPLARAGNGPELPPQMMGMQMPPQGDKQLLTLAGPYAQQILTTTILAFKNTLDWMIGYTDLLAVSAKIIQDPQLVYGDVNKFKSDLKEGMSEEEAKRQDKEIRAARKTQQNRIQWTLILGIPLLFVAYGILRWQMRMKARANVSLA